MDDEVIVEWPYTCLKLQNIQNTLMVTQHVRELLDFQWWLKNRAST